MCLFTHFQADKTASTARCTSYLTVSLIHTVKGRQNSLNSHVKILVYVSLHTHFQADKTASTARCTSYLAVCLFTRVMVNKTASTARCTSYLAVCLFAQLRADKQPQQPGEDIWLCVSSPSQRLIKQLQPSKVNV